jgi:hypothetical protein
MRPSHAVGSSEAVAIVLIDGDNFIILLSELKS